MSDERRFGFEEFGIGLFAGAAIGIVAGLLLAPQSGATTRRQITEYAEGAKDLTEDLVQKAKNNLDLLIEKAEILVGLQEKLAWKKIESLRADLKKYDLHEA
ncbi:YtxH domain-containing protein [Candidatus Oleimmundimicrobium sp.]|uniref:YtxH domain-containing protein n=1 Tax=Candidatus Oleimmundimicrobium sp. TaxID=3060597 RepID=UPI0027210F98|nr:YtxH domain-containing protein [Candidatus Oleimmundimicrobium sp.]MDO8886931.1 YtxH domain-containing protein [Candidatus Oleimmundimicrobium sp.]